MTYNCKTLNREESRTPKSTTLRYPVRFTLDSSPIRPLRKQLHFHLSPFLSNPPSAPLISFHPFLLLTSAFQSQKYLTCIFHNSLLRSNQPSHSDLWLSFLDTEMEYQYCMQVLTCPKSFEITIGFILGSMVVKNSLYAPISQNC